MGDVFRELNVLPSNFVTIESGGLIDPIKKYWFQDVNNIGFEPENIMQVKFANPKGSGADRLYGLSPLEAGNMALQSSNNIYDAKGNIVKNTGVNGLISSNSERSYTKEQADEMQKAWDSKNGNPSKYGKNLVTSANVNYTQLGLSPDKLQLLDGSIHDLRALCRIYSVDPKLFGDISASTYNNMMESKKGMYTDSVLPNLNLWLRSFNNWFINDWSKHDNKNYCLEADTSSIEVLQDDQKAEADKDKVIADTITSILNSNISIESKVQTLIYSIGMNEEEARIIVGTEITEDVN
jgi:HK97 family phage portal protein